MASSRRHDSVISTYALWELRYLYPDLWLRYLLGDSAFDAYALYKLALALGFKPTASSGAARPNTAPNKGKPRGSQEWKDTFAKRTAVERVNDALKNDYHAARSRVRGRSRIFFRYALATMRGHLEAWHKENPVNISEIIDSWTVPAQLAA